MNLDKYLSILYVFRVKSPTCGTEYIKIGKTTASLFDRHSTHSTGSPYVLNIHMTFRFEKKLSAALYEDELHKKMKKFLVRGEWFIYNEEAKVTLLESSLKIKNYHYDVRDAMLPMTRVIPNIDYEIGDSIFNNTTKEIRNELSQKTMY